MYGRFAGLILLLKSCYFLSQNGPAGVGTNTTSTNQNRIWYKSDVGVYNNAGTTLASNGNQVQQWNDQSGVGNHGIQGTLANRPVYRSNAVNGLPALKFSGSNWITATAFPSIANNVGYTYLIVIKDTSFTAGTLGDGAGDYIIDRGPPGAEANELAGLKVVNTNKFGFQKRDGGGGGLGGPVSTSTVSTSSYQVINYRQTPGGTKVYDIFVDGVLEASVSSADANYVPPVPQIGHHYQPGSSGMKGYISEFILYNYNVNTAQINILNSYLSAKYGTTLAGNDKYAGDTPGNGNFDFEVAGVGQEATGANNAAASSITGGLELTQATAMENGEYLLCGHLASSNFFNNTDIGGMSSGAAVGRWDRIWYLDWTHIGGTTETVDLTFDLSDGGMPATPASPLTNYKLLYRPGLSGNWTEITTASAITGDRILFSGIPYTTGDGYYTIGTLDNLNSTLPIGLLVFDAAVCENKICIDWKTASERNNDYFTVEKSGDGINFEKVAKVKGAGYSSRVINYAAIDNRPATGISYYHLKQTDFDGSDSYSPLVAVAFNGKNEFIFKVFPTTNNGLFTLETNTAVKIIISDCTGQIVVDDNLIAGSHSLNIQSHLAGIYFMKLISADTQQTIKFIKE